MNIMKHIFQIMKCQIKNRINKVIILKYNKNQVYLVSQVNQVSLINLINLTNQNRKKKPIMKNNYLNKLVFNYQI